MLHISKYSVQKETVTFSYGANKTATSLPYSLTVTNAAPDYFIDYPLQLKPSAQGIGSNLDNTLFQIQQPVLFY